MTDGTVITTTDYAGNYIYRNNALQFISQPEGYLELDGQGGYDYTYQYKDHLGNIRLSYKDNSTTSIPVLQILEENNYYPFGLKHQGYNFVVSSNTNAVAGKFKYNGKELQDDLIGSSSLDLYDYGARFYDAALGRWHVQDPLAEVYADLSTYNFCGNNSISNIDPDGQYFFGLFGSTRKQREAADKLANDNSGDVMDRSKRGISVVYTKQTSETMPGVAGVVEAIVENFNLDGSIFREGINQTQTDLKDDWSESSNFLAETSYKIMDDAFLFLQSNPIGALFVRLNERQHINGIYANQNEVQYGFIGALANFVPSTKGASLVNRFNTARFSKTFKGNLAKLAPNVRGVINRKMNKAIDGINAINFNKLYFKQVKNKSEILKKKYE